MRHLRIAARALLPLLGLATVSPAQQVSNHILSFSASPLADARTAATPVSHQISYKSSLFVIDDQLTLFDLNGDIRMTMNHTQETDDHVS